MWGAVLRKIRVAAIKVPKLTIDVIGITLAVPLVLIVRLIRPLVLIRFGCITSYIFGHFVFDTEYYLSEREIVGSKTIDLFFYRYKYESHKESPNEQWDKMVCRHLMIHPIIAYLYKVNQLIPGEGSHCIDMAKDKSGSRDLRGVFSQTQPHIVFDDKEKEAGDLFLAKFGLKSDSKFVCLFVRDSAYKKKYQNWKDDWSYHNHRDTNIENYELAAYSLVEKGYFVFRMGKVVEEIFGTEHSRILDYANSKYRSDFLDIWLMANCNFCISTGSGLDEVSNAFRKPILYLNYIQLIRLHSWNMNITVPKKLMWRKSKTPLSFMETMVHQYPRSGDYVKAGIELIDLTPDEIVEAVLEMEARLNGKWEDTTEDIRLQSLYWEQLKLCPNYESLHGIVHPESRVGTNFLRNSHEWFLAD